MYGLVTREGARVWTQLFEKIGQAKLAVRNNNFTYNVCVAKIGNNGRAVGEIYEYNVGTSKWEEVKNG